MGFAQKNITPDFPVPLAGFYQEIRISQGVHDKLYVRALYFERSEKGPVVILQLDLLNLDRICLNRIYQKTKIDKNRLLIFATHNHSGFGGIFDTEHGINHDLIPFLGEKNPSLIDLVIAKSIEAIEEASRNCVETTIRINRGNVKGLANNRRKPSIPCDNSLFTIEFHRVDKKKILLYNLCCHPTVLNGENLLLSADFPGIVAEKLEGISGGYDMVVFINGSAGDMSTRYTRRENSFTECERFAKIVIDALKGAGNGDLLPLEKIELRYHSFPLIMAKNPGAKEAREYLQKAIQNLTVLKNKNASSADIRRAATLVEGAQISLLKSSSQTPDSKPVETGILHINNVVIVCSPFELFSSLALNLKKQKKIEWFCYANEMAGYLADCDSWDSLDYEALSGDFARGEGERYMELISGLI